MIRKLISRQALAERLGVSIATLDRMARRGEIPAPVRISAGRIGYREEDVAAWEAKRPRAVGAASGEA